MSTEAPAELSKEELREALLELRRTYGTGLAWLRLGAQIFREGRVLETRALAEKPVELEAVTCFFCAREFPDVATMRAKHVDVHGMKARAEQHIYGHVDPSIAVVWTDGAPMEEP